MMKSRWAVCGLVALAYFLAARLGLLLAFEQTNASPVWPPSGLALAVVMLLGSWTWPGIWAGAFLANTMTFLSYGSAALGPVVGISGMIALGNTLEALTGAYLLRRWGSRGLFGQTGGVLRFAAIALGMCLVGAGIGPTVLCLTEMVPWAWYPTIWVTWWLGDAIGVLTVAPVFLSWPDQRELFWTSRRRLELAAFLAALWGVIGLIFSDWSVAGAMQGVSLAYLVIPCVIVAAFRFGAWGVAVSVAMASGMTVWGTVHGLGPLAGVSANTALLLSQAFLGVITVTGLLLAAALAERRQVEGALREAHEALEQRVKERTDRLQTMNDILQHDIVERKRMERRLTTQYAVVHALAESATIDEAAPRVIQAICEHAGVGARWEAGAVWYVDQGAGALRRSKSWHTPSKMFPEFEAISHQMTFPPGVGLPGQVWASGESAWFPDFAQEAHSPRAAVAAKEGLHAAFALPIRIHGEVFGVMEFFSQQIQPPDQDLLNMLNAIGMQIGLFIERKRAEEAFQTTKAQVRRLVDSSIIGVITADVEGRILEANEAFLTMTGYTKQDLPLHWRDLTPPDRASMDAEAFMQLKRFGTVSPWEKECLHKQGRRIPMLVGAVLLPSTQPPETYVGFVVNMTELKQTREALEQRTIELNRQRIAALNLAQDATEAKQLAEQAHQELQAAQLQLVQAAKLESVGRLAAGVAHEVKNPLATILIGLEHLLDNFAIHDEEVQTLLKDMTRSVERADRVIKGLLDFSAPNELVLKPTEMQAVIDQALELVRHALTKSHITVDKSLDGALPPALMDPPKMEQVFVNLFLNAMQAMPSGGTLGIAAHAQDHDVSVDITDTGAGIPEDKLPNVFDPFFTTKPPGKGTGLGLCVTKRIVELHGGTIAIRNRPPGGVQVTIRLHAEQEQANGHPHGQEAHSACG